MLEKGFAIEIFRTYAWETYHLCFKLGSLVAKPTIFHRNFGVCVSLDLAKVPLIKFLGRRDAYPTRNNDSCGMGRKARPV